MYVIVVSNYKKRMAILLAISLVWISSLLLAGFFSGNSLFLRLKLNNRLEFAYPCNMVIDRILAKSSLDTDAIETDVSLGRPQIENFSSYNSIKGKFSFLYPSDFIISPKEFEGSEIQYHVDFHNMQNTIRGFMQVWELTQPLEKFLSSSKELSNLTYKDFKSSPVNVNGLDGFLWDYTLLGNDNKYYTGKEVFLKKDGRLYRISLFSPEELWNQGQPELFWKIVKSLKIS